MLRPSSATACAELTSTQFSSMMMPCSTTLAVLTGAVLTGGGMPSSTTLRLQQQLEQLVQEGVAFLRRQHRQAGIVSVVGRG